MLVLTRKPGEGIVIGDNIRITVMEQRGGGIRIGIEAPPEMKIYREEIYQKISQENREATQWDLGDLDALSIDLSAGEKKP